MNKKKVSKMRVAFVFHCLFIPLLSFGVFYVYVNFDSILMAFTNREGAFTLEHFTRFFKEVSTPGTDFRVGLRNTMIIFGLGWISFPFKVLVSYFIYKKVPFYGFYRVAFFLPQIIFSVAQTLVFTRIVAPTGALAQMIGDMLNLGYAPELLADSRFANIVVMLHATWISFPGDLIVWGGTFARIPDDVLESASIDGVNWWQEFTRVIVPMVWPTVGLQMILQFCGIFSATTSAFLLTGGQYGTETIASWMYKILLMNTGNYESSNLYNYLSAAGIVLTTIAIAMTLVIRKYVDKAFEEVEF